MTRFAGVLIAIFVFALFVFALAGCGTPKTPPEKTPGSEPPLSSRELFERKKECFEAGQRAADSFKSPAPEGFFYPEFAYSPKRNSCIWAGGLMSDGLISQWVKDTYSNETLVEYTKEIKTDRLLTRTTEQEFSRKKLELFEQAIHMP